MNELSKTLRNKRGLGGGKIAILIGALIFIVIFVAVAPTMFNGTDNLSLTTGAPAWLDTVLPIILAGGGVFMIWRVFNN